MMKYIAWIIQNGEGCDYTIGCGHNLYELKAETGEEAIAEVKAMTVETVCFEWSERYANITIYEISDAYEVNVERIYKQEEEHLAALAVQEIEQKEEALYKELKTKYEGR